MNKAVVCVPDKVPTPEVCGDGKDNNCDGTVDENCGCKVGDTVPCGIGECKGVETCDAMHNFGTCNGPSPTHEPECDGKDHNCDGVVDKTGCSCVPGTTVKCGGPNIGLCHEGVRTCGANGQLGTDCVGAVGPAPEMCDGLDNDCDGQVDNPTINVGDDVPHGLCRVDQVCDQGHCVAAPPSVTPPPVDPGGSKVVHGEASGCACQVGVRTGPPAGSIALVLGAMLLVLRRRRS
jgi:hypothetical protein